MARTDSRVFAFLSAPTDTPSLSAFLTLPFAHRLRVNNIGAEGASALAAILKETQITNLRCAAAPEFTFMSMPIDTPHHPCTSSPVLAVSRGTNLVPKEQPLSPRA